MAESTRQPGEKPFTLGEASRGQGSDLGGIHPGHEQRRGATDSEARGARGEGEGESEWALPRLAEPHGPPGEGTVESKIPSQMSREWEEKFLKQGPPIPGQQLKEADKRRRKRVATS